MNSHFSPKVFNIINGQRKTRSQPLLCSLEQSSFSFIVTLSSKRFYGIFGVNGTINSEKFIYYLVNLTNEINSLKNYDIWKFIFIADNATIHKFKEVSKFLEKNILSLLTICPNSPWLNPVESYIISIKAKIKKHWKFIK